jgi:hypothetical protein
VAVDLLFKGAPLTGHPVNLVFGEDDAPPITDAVVSLVASFPRLTGSIPVAIGVTIAFAGNFPRLTGTIGVTYNSNTERPMVNQVAAVWQDADDARAPVEVLWDQGVRTPAATDSRYERAVGLSAQVRPTWQDTQRQRRGAEVRFQEATRLGTATRTSEFQDAARQRRVMRGGFQEGIDLRHARTSGFQDGSKAARNWAAGRYQEAVAFLMGVQAHEGPGADLRVGLGVRYQEGMPPPPGIWVPPGPQPEDPCYIPPDGDAVHLRFEELWSGSTNLLFVCETHGPTPGETVVVPIKEVFLVINSAVLIRVEGEVVIPTTSMSMSLDVDSWTWSFSASVPGYALPDIEPEDGVPVAVQATINGTPYRFIVESIARERTFGRNDLRIGGRGRAAVLDAPYAPIMTFRNEFNRTAQQIMNDILTDNGVPLGWDVEWNPDDWNVPAGVFNHQGSYISAMNQVAASIGAYLQPHNTDEALRVLSRYPVAPWEWAGVTPDFELPSAVMSRESIEWRNKPRYNRVYVMGQQVGVNGRVTRAGTAGDYLAPSIVDPLITEAAAARQRGLAVLSDTGRIATVGLRLPVLAETGIIAPGSYVKYVDGGIERIGLTRSVQVEVGLPSIWQTLGVETHVEPV